MGKAFFDGGDDIRRDREIHVGDRQRNDVGPEGPPFVGIAAASVDGDDRCHHRLRIMPPSARIIEPLMKLACSEARKATIAANSSGRP